MRWHRLGRTAWLWMFFSSLTKVKLQVWACFFVTTLEFYWQSRYCLLKWICIGLLLCQRDLQVKVDHCIFGESGLLDIAYSSSYAILNIEVYNIGYIFFHFWNSRWVAWIRRCLQDIAKKYWVVDGRNINFGWHIPLNAAEPTKHYMVQELLYMLPCLRWKFQLSAESQRCLS